MDNTIEYALEPMVSLASEARVGMELLAIGMAGWSKTDWRAWYRDMPATIERARIAGDAEQDQFISINVDTDQINDRQIRRNMHRLDGNVVVEWTERTPYRQGAARNQIKRAARYLEALKHADDSGTRTIAIDDFGAGISGVERLRLAKHELVKIDGSLTAAAKTDSRAIAIMIHIVRLAHALGAKVVVEWIETERDHATARQVGADYGQGRWYGRQEHSWLPHTQAVAGVSQ